MTPDGVDCWYGGEPLADTNVENGNMTNLWVFNTETLRLMEKDAIGVVRCEANDDEARDIAQSCATCIAVELVARGY